MGRPRLSSKERRRIAEHLDSTYQHRCFTCGRDCKFPYTVRGNRRCVLELAHYDGDPFNDILSNFRWQCRQCNLGARVLGANRLSALESVRVRPGGAGGEEDVDALKVNRLKEPMWVDVMKERLKEQPLGQTFLRGLVSMLCDISPRTHERYLEKHSSTAGEFKLVHDRKEGVVWVDLRRRPEN